MASASSRWILPSPQPSWRRARISSGATSPSAETDAASLQIECSCGNLPFGLDGDRTTGLNPGYPARLPTAAAPRRRWPDRRRGRRTPAVHRYRWRPVRRPVAADRDTRRERRARRETAACARRLRNVERGHRTRVHAAPALADHTLQARRTHDARRDETAAGGAGWVRGTGRCTGGAARGASRLACKGNGGAQAATNG